MRACRGEEDDVDDAAHLLDGVNEFLALMREVLHDESGDHEREERVELQVRITSVSPKPSARKTTMSCLPTRRM